MESYASDLCDVLAKLDDKDEVYAFLKDICTPQEVKALAERWRVCRLLERGDLSYREIHQLTGASLTTIGRVARFLRTESYQGYQKALKKMREKS